jgi:hypothetical protein
MTTPTLKLELTVAEIDMAFVLFQAARQDKHTYDEINTLMRKIQDQGKPQLEALAVKRETPPPAPKMRKPKAAPVAEKPQAEPTVDIPDLSDLKFN